MVDRSKPLPTSLLNEFIPEEVLLSLTSAANAGPCPENLLPPKKIKTPKVCMYVCVCVCVYIKYLGTFILTSSSLSIYLMCFIFQIVLRIF